jgi:hypothetical protein
LQASSAAEVHADASTVAAHMRDEWDSSQKIVWSTRNIAPSSAGIARQRSSLMTPCGPRCRRVADPHVGKTWFSARFAQSVDEQAPLVTECLDDVCVRVQRCWRALLLQAFLPRVIREAAALAPYLRRCSRADAVP